jgi:hypothetical protein
LPVKLWGLSAAEARNAEPTKRIATAANFEVRELMQLSPRD